MPEIEYVQEEGENGLDQSWQCDLVGVSQSHPEEVEEALHRLGVSLGSFE